MPVSQVTTTVMNEPATTVALAGSTSQPRPGPGVGAIALTT